MEGLTARQEQGWHLVRPRAAPELWEHLAARADTSLRQGQGTARLQGALQGAGSWLLLGKGLMQHMGIGQVPANKKLWLAPCQELGGLASL